MRVFEQARLFAVVGTIGFLVDGGVLTLMHSAFDLDLLKARLISFATAVTVTWYLNRHHTFAKRKDAAALNEWVRYTLANGIGALLNLGIFLWLVYRFELLASWPIIALAVASAVALTFNFLASRNLAFRYGRS